MAQYHAQFPYKALGDGELSLTEGERVQVLAQQGTCCVCAGLSFPFRLKIFPVEAVEILSRSSKVRDVKCNDTSTVQTKHFT